MLELVLLNLLNNYLLYYSTIATFLNFEKSTECQQKKKSHFYCLWMARMTLWTDFTILCCNVY